VELDLSGHITINGENGAGKTTLLRLLPLFFGESPSKILRGDENNVKMARYYFPTTACYVIFEYVRRDQKAMAVIHAESQTDKLVYRLIDSEYKPSLFMDDGEVVQTGALHRHLEKQAVFDSKALGLHAYRSVIQNMAGREHKHLASRFAFTGAAGKLMNIERIVTAILQRVTTFHDLKRMIVSSILDEQEAFSLRMSRKELQHWVGEYEAHYAVMDKTPVMAELDRLDHQRRNIESDFAHLHSRFRLLQEHHRTQEQVAEDDERKAKADKHKAENEYGNRLTEMTTRKTEAEARGRNAKAEIDALNARKAHYDAERAEQKMLEVDSIPELTSQVEPLKKRYEELSGEVKSITKVFEDLEADARTQAQAQREAIQSARGDAYQDHEAHKGRLTRSQHEHLQGVRDRHESERTEHEAALAAHRVCEAKLDSDVRNAQADPEALMALDSARKFEREAADKLEALHEKTTPLQRTYEKARDAFDALDEQIANGDVAIRKLQEELNRLLQADNADEDTLLGFLRQHKPEWVGNIGRIIPEETLLRTDLSPAISVGDDFYGVTIDLERLDVGRFASEETLQEAISATRDRFTRRREEVDKARIELEMKLTVMNSARSDWEAHGLALDRAKADKVNATAAFGVAERNVAESKKQAARRAQDALNQCTQERKAAELRSNALKNAHRDELIRIEASHRTELDRIDAALKQALEQIKSRQTAIDTELQKRLSKIGEDRDQCLRDNHVSPEVLNGMRKQINWLEGQIKRAEGYRTFVAQYRDWLTAVWPTRAEREQAYESARIEAERLRREHAALLQERFDVLQQKDEAIDEAGLRAAKHHEVERGAARQIDQLAAWPTDPNILAAGYSADLTLDRLGTDRARLQRNLNDCRDRIREGVEEIRREMCREAGTGPERFHASQVQERGAPKPGRECEWIEIFRTWFNDRHNENRSSLVQLGRTMAQNVSYFWKSLRNFKQNVTNFSTDLRANLEQGRVFASISDVTTDIRTHVDTQNYWEAVEALHFEYDAWHTQGDALPPPSFVAAARTVAEVLSEDKGLIADPVDLISLKISANVNNEGVKTASSEVALANMSSNGLSYIILCVVLIGFVNRIRRKEQVVIPFVVDELKDLSYPNAKTLLELLTRNNITMVSAFPDLDLDLAELFALNYKIQPGREVALIDKDALLADTADESDKESAYV
jgi:hypothetical protein